MDLSVRHGGSGDRSLVLLHGLGATGAVWDELIPILDAQWPGAWIVPDLPGHGGSAAAPEYSFDGMAAAVATVLDPNKEHVVVGHSLGGVVGLVLAGGRFGINITHTFGIGIKVWWTQQELEQASALAERPARRFATREEASRRFLRVSGLEGLVDESAAVVGRGVVKDGDAWFVAWDQRSVGVGAPPMEKLLQAATGKVVLAAGEHDHMVTPEQLTRLHSRVEVIADRGHNVHVEDPQAVWELIARHAL